MERSNFYTDQDVTADDLNFIGTSTTKVLHDVVTAVIYQDSSGSTRGVVGSDCSTDYWKNSLKVFPGVTSNSITVYPGIGFDSDGNCIKVEIDPTSPADGGPNRPTRENINWTTGEGVTYVKIEYGQLSGSVGSDRNGIVHYGRYYDSYTISVDKTPVTADQLLLATFTSTSGNQLNGAITDSRSFLSLRSLDSKVVLTNPPVTSWKYVIDHVRATGSVAPTQTNPHGLTGADIGGTDISTHQTRLHSNGIVPRSGLGTTASWRPSRVDAPVDEITFVTPTSGDVLVVDGTIITSGVANLSAITSDVTGSGTYYIYIDQLGVAHWTATNLLTSPDPVKTVIGRASIDIISGDITSVEDLRSFGSVVQNQIQIDISESIADPALLLNYNSGTLQVNLDRIRYQLGQLLGGNWYDPYSGPDINSITASAEELNQVADGVGASVTAVNLTTLTDGSDAEVLHTHPGSGSVGIPIVGAFCYNNGTESLPTTATEPGLGIDATYNIPYLGWATGGVAYRIMFNTTVPKDYTGELVLILRGFAYDLTDLEATIAVARLRTGESIHAGSEEVIIPAAYPNTYTDYELFDLVAKPDLSTYLPGDQLTVKIYVTITGGASKSYNLSSLWFDYKK